MAQAAGQRTESAKAAQAFARYVALGPRRSLRKLADQDVQQGLYKNSSAAMRVYADWSVEFQWQARIEQAANEEAERLLKEASGIDAETFLITSQLANERVKIATPLHADQLIKIRESVRRPAPKGNIEVTDADGASLVITFAERKDGPA